MTKTAERTFYAKLMLFGEYAILLGSKALSIPYHHFSARLRFLDHLGNHAEDARISNQRIRELADFFLKNTGLFEDFLDLPAISSDVDQGLFLDSTIPQGYGLGSSGALCAALYDKYALEPIIPGIDIDKEKLKSLKTKLASMESLFHGRSSGFDPCSCFIQKALCVDEHKNLFVPEIGRNSLIDKGKLFLIDTGSTEKTSPLVKAFLHEFLIEGNTTEAGTEFCRLNNECIDAILTGDPEVFYQTMAPLSAFQLSHLEYMIPEKMRGLWKFGLENGSFSLKLCGSGGGGFLMGFTAEPHMVYPLIQEKGFKIIAVFDIS
ncbi:MAG: mevalonate kinase [Bacteroidota bacterium]